MKVLVVALCWSAVLSPGATADARAEQQAGACATCHTLLGGELARPVEEWNVSVHRRNDIACELCHGGNAAVDLGEVNSLSDQEFAERQSRAMSKASGFIGRPAGKELFAMCGQCHDDAVARYAGSIMGRAYLEGRGGPSCVTCHNAHDNTMPAVPKACAGCHQDTTGFERIDPMNVTAATINELARIRIGLAAEKATGTRPGLAPELPENLETYQIGLVAFGAVLAVFGIGWLVQVILEKRR